MFKIKFRVMVEHTEEAWKYMRDFISNEGIYVYECREAEVLNDIDNSWVEDLYYLGCQCDIIKFIKFKIKHKSKLSFDERRISLW